MRIPTSLHRVISRRQFVFSPVRSSVSTGRAVPDGALPHFTREGVTPTVHFYRHAAHTVIQLDADVWRLHIGGLVDAPIDFSLNSLRTMAAVQMPCTLTAVTSTPTNLLMGHAQWRGVALQRLLDVVGVNPQARYAQFTSANGFVTYLPLSMLDNALVAYAMNDEILPAEQGFPVRLIVPGVYDYKMPKWLKSVELAAAPSTGHYESRGWSAEGFVRTTSALFTPRAREVVGRMVRFSGVAFAGLRPVTRVELSIDDGEWMPVPFVEAEAGSWTRWQLDWHASAPGDYLVKVRATDGDGFTQSDEGQSSLFPNGTSAIHAMVFRVAD